MALSAIRGIAITSTRRAAYRLTPPAAFFRPSVVPALQNNVRPYITVQKYERDDVLSMLDEYHATVMSANWADYLVLVYNGPFWEAELEKLTSVVQPYLHEPAVGAKFSEVQEMMDVLYQCEDVRDHINELAELATRASGFMGTGFAAEDKVENAMDHAKLCSDTYQKILDKHPNFKPKIEQTVGHGLAILRSKHKFKFGSMHRYFF
eukprot:TRINITY_DN6582_c0_g2_i1.p1 TRINITY_DN6582_c0_g2~~TRINITY_DN6582_c0_g2_i1.p1  ORF type:complete len:223 (-),score=46.92 TRINITY_DN6582_c0_g2_i1:45-665(-)